MMKIYFDNAATTMPDIQAIQQATVFLEDNFYNPSAIYKEGVFVHNQIKMARKELLEALCPIKMTHNFLFTSCGTEANNQVLQFAAKKNKNIVVNIGEHPSVYQTAKFLEQKGFEVRYANLTTQGSVDIDHLLSLIDNKTALVSIMHINNETGAINSIDKIAKLVKEKVLPNTCYVHVDGVQAFAKIPLQLNENIDFYTVSAHKIGGLKGVGGLYYKKNIVLQPLLVGGGQEFGLRSGTENVFGCMQFAYACKNRMQAIKENFQAISRCKEYIINHIDKKLYKVLFTEQNSPYILTLSAVGLKGEVLLHMLEEEGLLLSTGSACSSNAKQKNSRIMRASHLSTEELEGVIRLSFSYTTTLKECVAAVKILNQCALALKAAMH